MKLREEPAFSVGEKLDLVQAEADAVLRKEKGMEDDGISSNHLQDSAEGAAVASTTTCEESKSKGLVKGTKVNGRARRRKSTLSPDELIALMGI